MSIPIPYQLIEFVLLGPLDDRRQLQDSPFPGDVWIEYGKNPGAALDLLISPYLHEHAGKLAAAIDGELETEEADCEVAYVQGLVAVRLTFPQLLRHVVPRTKWWCSQWRRVAAPEELQEGVREKAERPPTKEHQVLRLLADEEQLVPYVEQVLEAARNWHTDGGRSAPLETPATARFLALAALLVWAAESDPAKPAQDEQIANILDLADASVAVKQLREATGALPPPRIPEGKEPDPLVFLVSLNRSAAPALEKSVPAVKADAAHTLFQVECEDIAWAVLDSGIDGRHPAFFDAKGKTRIKASYDFRNLRRIISLGNSRQGIIRDKNVKAILDTPGLVDPPDAKEAGEELERLAKAAKEQAPIHWKMVERYVKIDPETPPPTTHGTHVAGILGARKGDDDSRDAQDGMCPDIGLYDLRILAPDLKDTEFAIIAALQFIRHLNERGSLKAVQGANLSLSIPHDVRNFACGRTPICNECERLIDSGVVVVAAAGNHGFKNFQTLEGPYAGYAAFSITDPGNADGVITVGSTHRFWPHTYGVSFFSSRGPTGDGRVKPDLVAPGERIRAPLDGESGSWGDLDGTSMAAPHASGAAAMLMARYTELIDQPRRVKQILCDSATDLGRERTFQGHGMLDVLRAFQSL